MEKVGNSLIKNLTRYIDEQGLSARSLSLKAGLSHSAVSEIINKNPDSARLSTLTKLAAALNISVLDLLRDEERELKEQILMEGLNELPESERVKLIDFFEATLRGSLASSQPSE